MTPEDIINDAFTSGEGLVSDPDRVVTELVVAFGTDALRQLVSHMQALAAEALAILSMQQTVAEMDTAQHRCPYCDAPCIQCVEALVAQLPSGCAGFGEI